MPTTLRNLNYTCHPRLTWPEGHVRTKDADRKNTAFKVRSASDAATRIIEELEALTKGNGVPWRTTLIEICAECPVGRSGHFLSDRPRAGADPGAVLYFHLDGKPMVLACDAWTTAAGNLAAIAAHLEALRGIARWKVGTEAQLFMGYAALSQSTSWRDILGLEEHSRLVEAEIAYRRLAAKNHPDRGGSHEAMAALNNAIEIARKELK